MLRIAPTYPRELKGLNFIYYGEKVSVTPQVGNIYMQSGVRLLDTIINMVGIKLYH